MAIGLMDDPDYPDYLNRLKKFKFNMNNTLNKIYTYFY